MRLVLSVLALIVVALSTAGAPAPAFAGDDAPTLVDWMKGLGQDPSYEARAALFEARFPTETFSGTAAQNLALWRSLKKEHEAGAYPPKKDGGPGEKPGAPPARPAPRGVVATREFPYLDSWTVRVDPAGQVIAIDAPRETRYDGGPGDAEAPILPTLPASGGFVSAAMLVQKCKAFDDGIYAAVEVAAQDGAGTFAGKRAMLDAIRKRLEDLTKDEVGPATATPFTAARVAKQDVFVPPRLQPLVETQQLVFDSTPDASKPLGFYTWSDELRAIFRQDRILQAALPTGPHLDALLRALRDDPKARATYTSYCALVERLTNPFTMPDLRGRLDALDRGGAAATGDDPVAIVPPCQSHETTMANELLGAGVNSQGLDIMGEFVKGIRAGKVSLAVRPDSGWYDRTQWAMEPFLRPEKAAEAARLELSPAYRGRLEELFLGAIALARETHVKALVPSVPTGSAMPRPTLAIRPALTVEPLATAWLRRAGTYGYVRALLEATFGRAGLATMRRRTPEGPVDMPLDAELRSIETLLVGAYVRSCRELGHPVGTVPDADAADAHFVSWAKETEKDGDLSRDLRMMVPVMVDPQRGRVKVWAFLGWAAQRLTFRYVAKPTVSVASTKDGHAARPEDVEVVFTDADASAAYPVFAEAWTSTLRDRDEFRRLCDEKTTKAAIVEAIER